MRLLQRFEQAAGACLEAQPEAVLAWKNIFQHLPCLVTRRLLLRPPRMGDAGDMYAYACDQDVARYVLWDAHQSLGESRAFLRSIIRRNRWGGPGTFVIVERAGGRMIGTIGFLWMDCDNRSAEVGYSIAKPYWNRGLTTEALAKMLAFAFDTLQLNRVEGQHVLENPASGRVMQKAGMQEEGILRQRVYLKDHHADVKLYAATQSQWQAWKQGQSQADTAPVSTCAGLDKQV